MSDSLWPGWRSRRAAIYLFRLHLYNYDRKVLFLCGCVAQTLYGYLDGKEIATNEIRFNSVRERAWSWIWRPQLKGKISLLQLNDYEQGNLKRNFLEEDVILKAMISLEKQLDKKISIENEKRRLKNTNKNLTRKYSAQNKEVGKLIRKLIKSASHLFGWYGDL